MDILLFFQNIFTFFSNPDALVKIALILLLLLFLLFTLILARQISQLLKLVDQVSFSPVLKFTAYSLVISTLLLLLGVIFV